MYMVIYPGNGWKDLCAASITASAEVKTPTLKHTEKYCGETMAQYKCHEKQQDTEKGQLYYNTDTKKLE